MASRIAVLDDQTANQIAAGEVVERPSAAVKELVENALDAGATRVSIEIEEGGRRLIQVEDNGCGMTREEALLALQRHATSKIRCAEDLQHLATLGFRGEALPSIASVSRLELITRLPDSEGGVRLLVDGGEARRVEEIGAPPGTRVLVRDLFFNTPARLKFVKAVGTEIGHIADIVGRLAIAHPGVAVRLSHNGREVFATPGTGDARQSVASVWGRERAESMVLVSGGGPGLRIEGWAGHPEDSRPNRGQQAFFVNRRPVVSRMLSHAAEDAYRAVVPPGRYPAAALFLEVDPARVDVNVHPAKSEVRFLGEGEVHQLVNRALRHALFESGDLARVSGLSAPGSAAAMRPFTHATGYGSARPDVSRFLPSTIPARATGLPPASDPFEAPDVRLGLTVEAVTAPDAEAAAAGPWRLIGQIANTFIVGEGPDGMVLIDQHVAHERVLHSKIRRGMQEGGLEVQQLLLPITITLPRPEAAALAERVPELERCGFLIEPFGSDAFLVRGIPAALGNASPEAAVRDLASDLSAETGASAAAEDRLDDVISMASCKGAIKAGQPLGPSEMRRLVTDLLTSENPYFCPHGRPIIITVSHQELLKRFKRI